MTNYQAMLSVTPTVFRSIRKNIWALQGSFFVHYQVPTIKSTRAHQIVLDMLTIYNTVQYTNKVIVNYTMQITNNNANYRFVPP